ncbi:choice-of-anchor P family protein [Nocardioides sp. SR21]|uniref:choice-of-anchor P family protein n=1 Tax=Nocardioides sp. SR21 TaxID=2919501 RepID=UPI001FAAF22A|nr:choice-of-anchor P family protein [Nocardioides sp. SR21]
MKKILFPLAAAALVGAALPVSAGASEDPAFSGYRAVAVAAPVKIEIYEPTIPIPANPQLEVELGYTTVEADSGSSLGRASWLWPGDPVGEGMKTFVEQLGLPPQLGENGYPVQVNSGQPSGEERQADEPFPGMVMRTSATATKTVAQAGFSPDGQVGDGTESGDEEAEEAPNPLEQFGQAITGGLTTAAEEPDEEPAPGGTPGLPPELAGLVDLEGYTSSSQNVVSDGRVVTTARSALGDVSLLGGIVTLEGLVSTSTSTSNGTKGTTSGRTVLGGVTIAGQEFSFGPDGFVAAGQAGEVPPLPPQLTDALAQLGVRIELVEPVRKVKGDQAAYDVSGLVLDIDTSVLRKQLDALPLDDIIGALPNDPPELKSTLQALTGLAPRVVVTLGVASTQVDTVQGIEIPTEVPDNDPGGTDAGGGAGGSGGVASSGTAPAAGAPAAAAGDAPAAAAGDLPPAELTGSGLPPLYSIPAAILVAGIALAAVGGTWLRKAGVLALGGAGSCSHGLDSGLPDLRKA